MRTKDEILKEACNLNGWNPHAGIPMDTKEITFLEILIDIRDQILDTKCMLNNLLDPVLREALKEAGLLKE